MASRSGRTSNSPTNARTSRRSRERSSKCTGGIWMDPVRTGGAAFRFTLPAQTDGMRNDGAYYTV